MQAVQAWRKGGVVSFAASSPACPLTVGPKLSWREKIRRPRGLWAAPVADVIPIVTCALPPRLRFTKFSLASISLPENSLSPPALRQRKALSS